MARNVYSTNAVLGELAKGELQTVTTVTTGKTFTAGTEYLCQSWGDPNTRTVFPYISILFGFQSASVQLMYDWFVMRLSTEAAPDLSTADTLETYMKDKKILDRGTIIVPWMGGSDPKIVKRVYFNVGLEPGEYLGLVILPRNSSGAGDVVEYFKQEDRIVQITGA